MKHLFKIIFCVLVSFQTMAQDPNWSVDQNNFEHTMTFLSFVTIDGNRLENINDKVAVFVGNECRGTANLIYVASQDKFFVYLTAFANVANETLTVKVYDSQNDQVRDISTTINFEIGGHQGTLFQALSWADPILSSEAEIIEFGFDGISVLQETIDNRDITLVIEDIFDITTLTPLFEISAEAHMYNNSVLQTSSQDIVNFTNVVTYQVRSQDQSTLNTWTVTVIQINNDLLYQKRNVVCYQKGAIKVSSNQNGMQVLLLLNGSQIDQQTVVNGEVLFDELEENTYIVQIGNITKEITINLNIN